VLRMGRTTCMSFAPFDLKLATGASDSLCSVYAMGPEEPRTERDDEELTTAVHAVAGGAA
jgi:hypothetical protein